MALSISPTLILKAAQRRGWKTNVLNEQYSLYRLELPGGDYRYIRNVSSLKSSAVNAFISNKKDLVYAIADDLQIRTPATMPLTTDQKAQEFLNKYKKIVVKPSDGAHGDGITVNISNLHTLTKAIEYAKQFSDSILLQQQIEGDDHRLLFIGGKLAAAAIRKPAFVVGDGVHTVRQLITAENNSTTRAAGYQEMLTNINEVDAQRYLDEDMIDAYVAQRGEEVRVMGTANIGKGGVAIDVTETVDEHIVCAAQKLVAHLQMGICGVDFMVMKSGESYLIEINAVPSLGLHENPYKGQKQNTPDKFLDWLAEKG